MTITKIGHCCLVIKINGVRFLTDPGNYTDNKTGAIDNLDFILITHEHPDHLHVESVKTLLTNSPDAKIITNSSVGKILTEQGINFEILEHGQSNVFKEISIEGYGNEHAEIYGDYGLVQNTGYLVDNKLLYPGDAFYTPGKPVEILALPVAGPWAKIKESIDYAKRVKPKICFPIHDGSIRPDRYGSTHGLPPKFLEPEGIQFKVLDLQEPTEFDL